MSKKYRHNIKLVLFLVEQSSRKERKIVKKEIKQLVIFPKQKLDDPHKIRVNRNNRVHIRPPEFAKASPLWYNGNCSKERNYEKNL